MKRNNLTTAIVAGIVGVAGIASVSNAVNLNPDGLGQVLVYPYYTVNNDLNTLISVVNTTDEVKAVKVRFLEGKNSRECLDFNLFLSPYDVWTAGLIPTAATSLYSPGHEGEPTVKLLTADKSCSDPSANVLSGYEFLPWAFDVSSGYDGIGRSLERCTEGHFEMIEMGVVSDATTATGITHVGGIPANCGVISSLYANRDTYMSAPTGGLFGSASIVDVAGGTDITYNADAINDALRSQTLTNASDLQPSLATLQVNTSNVFHNGAVQTDTWLNSSVQAISAIYMHNNIYGEYELFDDITAHTEWVVTFPTKNFYVDAARTPFGSVPYEPFTAPLTENGACEIYGIQIWDREERVPEDGLIIEPPSPTPPGQTGENPLFCWETNVVEFEDTDRTSGDSIILGSRNTTHLVAKRVAAQAATPTTPAVDAQYFVNGWVALSFSEAGQQTADNLTNTNYVGLPVTGFAVQSYVNANAQPGILAAYAGIFKHRYSRSITSL